MIRILFSNSGRRTYLIDYCNELVEKGYKLKIFASDTNYATSSFYVHKKIKTLITPEVSKNKKRYLSKLFKICKKEKR